MRNEYRGVLSITTGLENIAIDYKLNPNTPVKMEGVYLDAYLHTASQLKPDGSPKFSNGPKVAIRSLWVDNGALIVRGYPSSYYIQRGLPYIAPELPIQAGQELKEKGQTNIPMAACLHSMIIITGGNEPKMIMTVRGLNQGNDIGTLSPTFEEQMEPDIDSDPLDTSYRGGVEELGLYIPRSNISLLGIGAEKLGSAYVCFGTVSRTPETAQGLLEKWQNAQDKHESSALLTIPVTELGKYGQNQIPPAIWQNHIIGGEIKPATMLNPHPTAKWRLDLFDDYLAAQKPYQIRD